MPYYIAMDRRSASLISIARRIFELPTDSFLDGSSYFNPDTIILNELFYPVVVMKDFVYDGKRLVDYRDSFKVQVPSYSLPMPANSFAYTYKDSLAHSALRYLILNHPEQISYTEEMLTKGGIKTEVLQTKTTLADLSNLGPTVVTADKVSFEIKKASLWTTKGTLNVSFKQNYMSDNWFQGANNNVNFGNVLGLSATYNDLKKVVFSNSLRYRLGFNTLQETRNGRKYQINDDKLDLVSTLNLQAIGKWSYSLQADLTTQTFKNYSGDRVNVAFLSPGTFNLSLGMNYGYKNKPGTFSINFRISPINYNLKFVMDTAMVDQTRHGIRPNKKSREDVQGLLINSDIIWTLTKVIKYTGRFKFYSPYDATLIEFENTFNFTVNRFLTTNFYLYLKYDDARKRQEGENSYLQYKEYFGFGLNFWW